MATYTKEQVQKFAEEKVKTIINNEIKAKADKRYIEFRQKNYYI